MVEVEAVRRALYLARQAGCKLHFVHLSTGEAVREVVKARNEGQDVTCETCVHYLTLTVDDFKKIGPEAKCSPALRTKDVLDDLWKMVESGAVSAVTSDHSPAPLSMKQDPDNNIFNIWGGITGAQNNVDLFYDVAVKSGRLSILEFTKLIAQGPAELFGLKNKGQISIGYDADFTFLDPDQSYIEKPEDLYYKNPHSAYIGRKINARVTQTILRGKTIYTLKGGIVGQSKGMFLLNSKNRKVNANAVNA